jgi:hypothetical protein
MSGSKRFRLHLPNLLIRNSPVWNRERENVFEAAMYCWSRVVTSIAISALTIASAARASDQSLAIVGAGVQASEDAPFVSSDYLFLPGDYVYFTFEVTGFAISGSEDDDVRSISLSYEVTPEDASGTALAKPEGGRIATTLSPQDKNWTPKRRASFLLPSFVAAGTYRVHIAVRDEFGKAQIQRDFPFQVGGIKIVPSKSISIENFRFLRSPEDSKPLEIPAYSPGDHVFARFEMAGYKFGPGNKYDVAYDITVLGPDGKPFIRQPNAAELASGSFYPAQFVPAVLNLITKRSNERGEYILVVRARDLLGNRSCETRQAFSLE